MARFAPVPWAAKSGLQIASLRNWEPNYRIDTLIDAFAQLVAARPDAGARLHLLGGGALEAALRERAAAHALGERVVFHGRLDDAGMAAVLAACKLSVTVPQSDATSVAMLESMACGLALVASDLPANRAWLDEADDLLVPAGDAAALARALIALADDDARAQRLGALNRARIERDGQRKVQMDGMSLRYESLLAERGRR